MTRAQTALTAAARVAKSAAAAFEDEGVNLQRAVDEVTKTFGLQPDEI